MRAVFLCLALFLGSFLFAQTEGPRPKWVSVEPIPEPSIEWQEDGFQLLAYDHQVNFAEHASFYRYALLLATPEAVSLYSNIEESYDPSFQKLVFHKIEVIRDGEVLSLMEDHQADFIRLESNRSRLIYDSSMSVVYNLSDIRPGDILTYEYSRTGAFPSFPNHVYSSDFLETYRAAGYLNYRVLVPKGTKFKPILNNGAPQPKYGSFNGYTEWKWESRDVKPMQTEDGEPQSFDPRPSVQITTHESWAETNAEAMKLYRLDQMDLTALKVEAEDIAGTADAGWEQITALSFFVQDQIRYLGFESGVHAFKPHDPQQVLNQRYGDCKDKSVLLVGLIRSLGYEAYPIWVNTYRTTRLNEAAPSPLVFNHCVMMAIHEGDTAYIDPTQTSKGGVLPAMTFPEYGKGLLLKEGQKELLNLKPNRKGRLEITDIYGVSARNGDASQLRVETLYEGLEADWMRDYFNSNSAESIAEDFTNYYKEFYPSIRFTDIPKIEDDRKANRIFVREFYEIDSIWEDQDESSEQATFRMPALRNMVTYYEDPERSAPLAINLGKDFKHTVKVNLPEEWPLEEDDFSLERDEFSYTYKVRPNASETVINIEHEYRVLKNEVKAEDYNRFVRDHDKILANVGYYVTRVKSDYTSSSSAGSSEVLIYGIRIVALVLFIVLAVRLYRNYDPRPRKIFLNQKAPSLGGWMILPFIGLIFTPFKIIYETIDVWDEQMFSNMAVFLDSDSGFYNLEFALAVIIEDIVDIGFATAAVLLAIMFGQRRSSIPRLMVIFYAINVVWLILDYLMFFAVDGSLDVAELGSQVFRGIVSAAIWIPYFINSERVQETFISTYAPVPMEETAESLSTLGDRDA